MKDKTAAALLAFFLGGFGVHRFYLGQTGVGILYFFLMFFFGFSFILGFIDFIIFLTMDQQDFDYKYNRKYLDLRYRNDTDFVRRRTRRAQPYDQTTYRQKQSFAPARSQRPQVKPNPYKRSGIEKYKNYDFEGAVEDFEKALSINPKDKAVHFNIACAYSLLENKQESLYHLSKAVENGFKDYDRIASHDALAYLRIQDEYDDFVKNGYKLSDPKNEQTEIPPNPLQNNLLDQLRQLGELKEKGLLTEKEFEVQKRRLLND